MKKLIGLVNDIDQQIPIAMEDKVLIAISLNSEAKIKRYAQWVKSRLNGETLEATETEVIQTAVKIGKEE
ncbi:MAG: hypothetical protein IJQ98_05000 [Oscillospiraceae bacterium]|nr:hypothetical protein [Oscillospiraceae bacterium]